MRLRHEVVTGNAYFNKFSPIPDDGQSNMSDLNILLISADQWRGDCLGCAGNALAFTPNLDRLATDGTRFSRHFAQATPCGPSRASLLTGLYAMNHRSIQNGTPLDHRHTNIALEARRMGCEPMLFGYTDTTNDPRLHSPRDPNVRSFSGVLPGFREGVRYQNEVFASWQEYLAGRGYSIADDSHTMMVPPAPAGRSFPPAGQAAPYPAEHSDTAYTANRILDFLRARRLSSIQGWFIHAVFFRPHPPFFAPSPFHARVDPKLVSLPLREPRSNPNASSQHPFLTFWASQQKRIGYLTGHQRDVTTLCDDEIRQMRAQYLGLIEEVDQHIGRLLDFLVQSGQYERTLIIFTCDHGEQWGDHGLWGKGGYFDQSYHIPLLVKPPKSAESGQMAEGRVVNAFTESVDILPTILDLVGGLSPLQCDGQSLRSWLKGRTPQHWRSAVHWEYDFRDVLNQTAESYFQIPSTDCHLNVLRSNEYKLVHFPALPPLLFDLQADSEEFVNRADHPDYQGALLEMTQRLLNLRMQHADQTLANSLVTPNGWIQRNIHQSVIQTG